MKKVSIYTDGACSGNPGPGGWCAILVYNGHEKEICGSDNETTNNRMEMQAVIEGLKLLKEKCAVDLYSDSSYIINAFNEGWLERWVEKDWKRSDRTPVKNIGSWQILHDLNMKHDITWIKVKGHSDNEYNNRCDKTAVAQTEKLKEAADDTG
jgi:ribonuclease HI